MKLFPVIAFLCISFISYSQHVVLEDYPADVYKDLKGPGSKHYFHPYFSAGIIADFGKESETRIKILSSGDYHVGMRYKRNVFHFYQVGFDISGRFLQYSIKDGEGTADQQNPFSNYWGQDKQDLRINSLGLEIYNRLKAGRGNNLGYYVDAGLRADWNFSNKWIIISRYDNSVNPAGKIKMVNRKLSFTERTAFSASARLGFNKLILYGNYRLSDLFKDTYTIPELPRLTAGIQLVL